MDKKHEPRNDARTVLLVAANGDILTWDRASAAAFGWPDERSKNIADLLAPEALEDWRRDAAALLSEGGSRIVDLAADGRPRRARVRLWPQYAPDGQPAGCAVDIAAAPPGARGKAEQLGATPLSAIIKLFPGTFYVIDRDGRFVLWNTNMERVTEMTASELERVHVPHLFSEPERTRIAESLRAVLEENQEALVEADFVSRSGKLTRFLMSGTRIHCEGEYYVCGMGLDMTRRQQQENLLRLRERALHAASNGIIISRCAGKDNPIEYVNPAFERITGYSAHEVVGRDSRFMAAPGLDEDARMQLREAICERREANVIFRNLRKDGTLFWNELNITPVHDDDGVVNHYIGVINDITAVKQRTSHLEHRVNHDPLTGLANRNLLWDRLEQALHMAQRNKTLVATMLIDLNKFKQINDTFGHDAGDVVLTSVAKRMQASVRDSDTVARLSGDEFVLVLANQPSLRYTLRMIDRLREALQVPVAFDSSEIAIGAAVGVSIYPHDGDTPVDLVKAADIAMYHAKSVGKSEVHFYSADMKSSSDAKHKMETDMRAAIDNDEFFLLFQPRLGTRTDRYGSAEALLRWRHPELGVLTPISFMAEAEENGMVRAIGARVLDLAVRFLRDMRDDGFGDLMLSVNVGYREISQPNYIADVHRRLTEAGLPVERLELEVDEKNLVRNLQLAQDLSRQMHDAGIKLSIDDFGDGMTSLSHLPKFAPAHLKLNKMAVSAISQDGDHGTLATVLIDVGHDLNIEVVGTGVETELQAAFLRENGCDELQGSFISHPLGAGALKQLLAPTSLCHERSH
jgi:diguanylate cyclase (GGDEF)-like protein/PAS domain S-box-containing protein